MSIYGVENYGNYKLVDELPEWMKAERYDYCEPFFENALKARAKRHNFLAQIFLSIFG
jgi:hypothetical protein